MAIDWGQPKVQAKGINWGATAKPPTQPMSSDIPAIEGGGPLGSVANFATGTFNAVKNFATGAGAAVEKSIFGIPQAMASAVSGIGGAVGLPSVQKGFGQVATDIGKMKSGFDTKDTASLPGKAGALAADTAIFAAPGSAITKAQGALGALAKDTPWIVQKLAQVLPEAIGVGATEYAKSGGDTQSAKTAALTAGVLSSITHVGADAFRKLIPQTVKENVAGFMKWTGKVNLKDLATGKKVDDATSAFTTMVREAPSIKVKDINGVEKTFDPKDTSFFELPQVLHQTKAKIYDAYTKMAETAGDLGAKFSMPDMTTIKKSLEKFSGAGYTPAYERKANEFLSAINRFGKVNPVDGRVYFKDISPKQIQTLLESINKDVNPLSDAAGAQVASDLSTTLREMLDSKISSATGEKYQQLRTAYSQLKSVEKDVLDRAKVAMRKSGSLPSDFIDGLGSIDMLQGLMTANPSVAARGTAIIAIKNIFKYLRDPEIKMQRAFRLLSAGPEDAQGPLSQRFFGSLPTVTKGQVKKAVGGAATAGAAYEGGKAVGAPLP